MESGGETVRLLRNKVLFLFCFIIIIICFILLYFAKEDRTP